MRVFAVAAHPAGDALGAGGTKARLAAGCRETWVCTVDEMVTAVPGHTEQQARVDAPAGTRGAP